MAPIDRFSALEKLRIANSGDAFERRYYPQIEQDLPGYEIFWKRFIVLLTNRVNATAGANWIALRRGVPIRYEKLLMANYTTFVHCVVALNLIEEGKSALTSGGFNHPQLFFFSMKACLDSLQKLKGSAEKLLRPANIACHYPIEPSELVSTITKYRNVLTHESHMGRGWRHGRPFIPKVQHLSEVRRNRSMLWSYTMSLEEDEMIDAIDLESQLWHKLAHYLNEVWYALAAAFDVFRDLEEFVKSTDLQALLPISSELENAEPNAKSPYAASGTLITQDADS